MRVWGLRNVRILNLHTPRLLHFFQLPEQLVIRTGTFESIRTENSQTRAEHDDDGSFQFLGDGISRAHVQTVSQLVCQWLDRAAIRCAAEIASSLA